MNDNRRASSYRTRIPTRSDWLRYEAFKQDLYKLNLPQKDYEREIKRYCNKYKL